MGQVREDGGGRSSVLSAARSESRRDSLVAMRDVLAAAVDGCDSMRDLPALTRQLSDVLRQLEEIAAAGPKTPEVRSPLDELNARRAARGATAKGAGVPKVAGQRG